MMALRCRAVFLVLFAALPLTHELTAGENRWTKNPLAGWDPAADPSTPGLLYAGSEHGIMRSVDHGANWLPLGLRGDPLAAGHSTIVYATDTRLDAGFWVQRIFKSDDRGEHWSSIRVVQSAALLLEPRIELDRDDARILYVVDTVRVGMLCPLANAIQRSVDGGATWQVTAPWGEGFVSLSLAVDPLSAGTVYVSTAPIATVSCSVPAAPAAVFKSADAGSTWVALPNAPPGLLAVDPSAPATIYSSTPEGLFRSTDGGSTFALRSRNLPLGVRTLEVSPVNSNRLYASTSGDGVWTSGDAGASWVPINQGLESPLITDLAVEGNGEVLHAATPAGLFDYEVSAESTILALDPGGHPFRVTVQAFNPRTGETGVGLATAVNDFFGYFSLPALTGNPANPEVVVKILDGTGFNGAYWVFSSTLTGLEFELTVMEELTGRVRQYTKPAGSTCGEFDTEAFPVP